MPTSGVPRSEVSHNSEKNFGGDNSLGGMGDRCQSVGNGVNGWND